MRAQCFPALGGSITDSQSPMVANGGTVMKPACASEFRCRWSILLTFKELNELGATPRNLSSADTICSVSNTGRTTTGRHHEENSLSDGRYSRIRSTFIRG
jgi:hypothetical protein